jgi:acyl-CoA synthetase (AMP-forming)/AMP-acid ligase II
MFLLPNILDQPDGYALSDADAGRRWSWQETAAATLSLAALLKTGFKKLAFLFCRNDVATVIAYLAVIEAGHAVALLDEGLPHEFQERLVSLYAPDLILISARRGEPSWQADYDIVGDDPALQIWQRTAPRGGEIHANLALLLSTSGSTGTPQFVRLTRQNIESNARSIHEALVLTPRERPITSLPIHYSYGLSVVNSHLAAGAEIVLTNESSISSHFWDRVRDYGCTSWSGVPYSYHILQKLDIDKLNVPTLKTLTQAGGKLNNGLVEHFRAKMSARGGRMFVMYGQTEATARIAVVPADRLEEKLGSAGQAIPGGSLAILTDHGLSTEANVTGEVVYSGPNVMLGYASSRADLSAGDTLSGCLCTGDTGLLDSDGFLYLSGRRKRDAKIFGMRLNMDEIEDMMRVYGPTAVLSSGEKLVLFCEHGGPDLFSRYRRTISSKLRMHAGAFEFRRVEQLPLKANGKIDYAELKRWQ